MDFKKDDCVREVNPESVDGGEMPDTKIHNTNYNFKTGSNLDLVNHIIGQTMSWSYLYLINLEDLI